MAYDEKTAERVRRALAGRDATERKMMGATCFMVSGSMCCGVTGSAVMVRVGPEAYQLMLTQPHVRPMEIGGRRPTGFVLVDPEGCRTERALTTWVQRGVHFVETFAGKDADAEEIPAEEISAGAGRKIGHDADQLRRPPIHRGPAHPESGDLD